MASTNKLSLILFDYSRQLAKFVAKVFGTLNSSYYR